MSIENFPEKDPQDPVAKGSKGRNVLTIGLLVALLGTWGYIIYDNNKSQQEKQSLTQQVSTSDSARNELQNELNDATRRLDLLKTENAQAAGTLQAKDKEMAEMRNQIQAILRDKNATQAQLDEARRLIAQLKGSIDTYASEIAALKEQNQQLTARNAEVTGQRDSALKIYDSAAHVIKEKENVIDVGSTLHASNFKIVGVQEKNNGKEKETTKARRVDKLKITFDIDENRITPSGAKEIYVAITSPDGRPVTVEALGSGKFETRDGAERFYTKKISINYVQGQKQEVTVEWSQNSSFKTGNYKVEIYNNGFLIGEGTVSFRKGGLFG